MLFNPSSNPLGLMPNPKLEYKNMEGRNLKSSKEVKHLKVFNKAEEWDCFKPAKETTTPVMLN